MSWLLRLILVRYERLSSHFLNCLHWVILEKWEASLLLPYLMILYSHSDVLYEIVSSISEFESLWSVNMHKDKSGASLHWSHRSISSSIASGLPLVRNYQWYSDLLTRHLRANIRISVCDREIRERESIFIMPRTICMWSSLTIAFMNKILEFNKF